MPVQITVDNKTTDHFEITFRFDEDALAKVGPCVASGAPDDAEGNSLIAFMFKQWCDHKASDWNLALAKAAARVELAEAASTLDGEVIGPAPQIEGGVNG